MSRHKRKRLVLRLTPEEQSDPKSILAATRAALKKQADLTLVVQNKGCGPDDEPSRRMPLEQLETAAHELAAAVLLQKKREAEAVSAAPPAPDGPAEPAPPKGSLWWRAVKATGHSVAWLAGQGFRIAIREAEKVISGEK